MKHSVKITMFLLLLFFCAQLIGLGIINSYAEPTVDGTEWQDLPSVGGFELERPDVAPSISFWYILGAILLGTALILLIIHLGRTLLWKFWFFLAAILCLQIAFAAFIPELAALIIAAVFAWIKVFKPNVYIHNLTELFLYGGLAAIFVPMLDVLYAFILLIALSAYDAYAVWHSKHMVKLAKFQTKSGIFAGLLLPYKLPKLGKKKGKMVTKKVKTAVLGGGDIGFPMFFSGSVLIAMGFWQAFVVTLGATFSLWCLLTFSKKDRFYPAMPFLTAGCILGYVVALLI